MSRKEKTLKEVYEYNSKVSKIKKITYLALLGILVTSGVVFTALKKEFVLTKYHEIANSFNRQEQIQTISKDLEANKQDTLNDEETETNLEYYDAWKESYGDSNFEEDSDYNNPNYPDSVVFYEREEDSDGVISERTWKMLEDLKNQTSQPNPPSSSPSGSTVPTYEETEFDMNACIDRCDTTSTPYYNTCVSSYEKYIKSAQDAYNNSLSSCIADLGRNDPVCKTNAQKLYDLYMSSPIAQKDKTYCTQEKQRLDANCYEDMCVNNPLNN